MYFEIYVCICIHNQKIKINILLIKNRTYLSEKHWEGFEPKPCWIQCNWKQAFRMRHLALQETGTKCVPHKIIGDLSQVYYLMPRTREGLLCLEEQAENSVV